MKPIYTALLTLSLLCGATAAERELSTTLTAGVDSRYVLYGYRQDKPLIHTDLYLSLPVSERVTVWGGSWAGTLTDDSYREVDLYAGFDVALTDSVYSGLAYSYFDYLESPWGDGDAHELSGHLTWYTGPFSFGLHDLYDNEGEGHLARAVTTYSHSFTEKIGLTLRAEAGYSFDYYFTGDAPNHALFRADLPIQLTERLSIAPFIAHSLALDAIDEFEEDQFYGGCNASLSF